MDNVSHGASLSAAVVRREAMVTFISRRRAHDIHISRTNSLWTIRTEPNIDQWYGWARPLESSLAPFLLVRAAIRRYLCDWFAQENGKSGRIHGASA